MKTPSRDVLKDVALNNMYRTALDRFREELLFLVYIHTGIKPHPRHSRATYIRKVTARGYTDEEFKSLTQGINFDYFLPPLS